MRRVAVAVVLVLSGFLSAVPAACGAAPFRKLASGVVSFASDGVRYAAWESSSGSVMVVLDTRTGRERRVRLPPGCRLQQEWIGGGVPIVSALNGWFLLNCESRQRLFHAPSGSTSLLPREGDWYEIGSRYILGHGLYDRHTHTVGYPNDNRHLALEQPGASVQLVCPAVRRVVLEYDPAALTFGGNLAYRDDFLARSDFVGGDVQLYRCSGPIILHAAGRSGACGGEPWDIDLRGGLLSWDTGCPETDAGGKVESFPGRIYTYSLVRGTRESWAIPRLHTFSVLDGVPRGAPQRGPRCTCGLSSHTANTVFWIATHTFGCGEKFCNVATVDVYAARRKEHPWGGPRNGWNRKHASHVRREVHR